MKGTKGYREGYRWWCTDGGVQMEKGVEGVDEGASDPVSEISLVSRKMERG